MYHKDQSGIPEYISTTAIDISEIKEKEDRLIKQTEDLRSLTHRLQNVREEERKAMAKELHDELGQNLTVLKLNAAWLADHIDGDITKRKELLLQIQTITEDTVATSRRLYNSLYPQMLDDIGFVGTITWHANTYLKNANIDFEIQSKIDDKNMLEFHDVWLVLYRTYQECITNILRYAKANVVIIELDIVDNNITMNIMDDGVGFEIEKVDTKMHHGLLGMRERVYALNGNLAIESEIGKGTRTNVTIPMIIPSVQ